MACYHISWLASKPWVDRALTLLRHCLSPVPMEVNELDWKSDLSENKNRLAQHLCAFANLPGGGFLVFGIAVNAMPCGCTADDADRIVAQLANLGREAVEAPIVIDQAVIEWQGVHLLAVYVPEQNVKPIHLRGKSVEDTWIRSGGTTRKASRIEVGALLLNSQTPRWEKLRASPFLSADDAIARLDIESMASLLERPVPAASDALVTWLGNESVIEIAGGGVYVTNFGAISAARDLSIYDALGRKRIRVIRYQGTNKVTTIDEQIGRKGYAVEFEGLIRHIKQVLPHSEIIREALRTETSVYPDIALRELIANALIHQDFSISGSGPMIEIFDNRIEITSPGSLLPGKTPDRLIGTTPQSRNELLASAFRRYRLCEERGTGFQKVVTAVELFGLPPVSFVSTENAFTVVLYAPRRFSEMSQSERIEACYQHAVLRYLSSSALTNTSLRERLKMSARQRNQVTNLIADAVAAGRIKRKDPNSANKFAEYFPYWA